MYIAMYFSICLDSGLLSGNVQTLLFIWEGCNLCVWEIEPNETIGPMDGTDFQMDVPLNHFKSWGMS